MKRKCFKKYLCALLATVLVFCITFGTVSFAFMNYGSFPGPTDHEYDKIFTYAQGSLSYDYTRVKTTGKIKYVLYSEVRDYSLLKIWHGPISGFEDIWSHLNLISYGEERFAAVVGFEKGVDKNLVIPASIENLPVKIIYGFDGADIKTVTIPDGVEIVVSGAFGNCSELTDVYIGKDVNSIGVYAFAPCPSLASATVSAKNEKYYSENGKVKEKGSGKVVMCAAGTVVTVPEGATDFDNSFAGYANASKIVLPASVVSDSAAEYINSCFPNLSEIEVAEDNPIYCTHNGMLCSVRKVESQALLRIEACPARKTSVTIDGTIGDINGSAFQLCSNITEIDADGSEKYRVKNGVLYDDYSIILAEKDITSFTLPADEPAETINRYSFAYCADLKNITVTDGITHIAPLAFVGCNSLENITISDSVSYIGREAFSYTKYYKTPSNWTDNLLYIGNHLIIADGFYLTGECCIKEGTVTIAEDAFFDCQKMTGVTMPDSVLNICSGAFVDCTNLREVKLSRNLQNIESGSFSGCNSLTEFSGRGESFVIEDDVVYNKDKTEILAFPLGKKWQNDTFDIPYTVESFDRDNFNPCYNVKKLTYLGTGFKVDSKGAVYTDYASDDISGARLKFIPNIDSQFYTASPDTKIIDCTFIGSEIGFADAFYRKYAYYIDGNRYAIKLGGIYDIDELPDGSFYNTTKFIFAGSEVEIIRNTLASIVIYNGTKEEANEKFLDDDGNTGAIIVCNPNNKALDRLLTQKSKKIEKKQDLVNPVTGEMITDGVRIVTESGHELELSVTDLNGNEQNSMKREGFTAFALKDISLKRDGVPVKPENPVEIYFKKDYIGRDPRKLFIVHQISGEPKKYETFTFNSEKEKYKIYDSGNYWKITVTSLSPFGIFIIPEISINNNPRGKTIDWGQVLRLKAEADKGYTVHWFADGKDTGKTGETFEYDSKSGNAEIKAVLYSADGRQAKDPDGGMIADTEKIEVRSSFILKLIAFFKYTLFRVNKYVEN